jgi:3D (Asp-Asp-Asp) domain-containing protein
MPAVLSAFFLLHFACAASAETRLLRVTAYADHGVTASGQLTRPGTCAAPAGVPFGSRVYVPRVGWLTVTDRTARRFRHNTIDIFMPSRADCVRFGVRFVPCAVQAPDPTKLHRGGAEHTENAGGRQK